MRLLGRHRAATEWLHSPDLTGVTCCEAPEVTRESPGSASQASCSPEREGSEQTRDENHKPLVHGSPPSWRRHPWSCSWECTASRSPEFGRCSAKPAPPLPERKGPVQSTGRGWGPRRATGWGGGSTNSSHAPAPYRSLHVHTCFLMIFRNDICHAAWLLLLWSEQPESP